MTLGGYSRCASRGKESPLTSTVRAALELVFLFLNPLVIILLIASVASLLLGDATDAVVDRDLLDVVPLLQDGGGRL